MKMVSKTQMCKVLTVICFVTVVLYMISYLNHFYTDGRLDFSLTSYTSAAETNPYMESSREAYFTDDTIVEQELPAISDDVDAIRILFRIKRKNKAGEITLRIQNAETMQIFLERIIPYNQVENKEYLDLPIDELSSEQRKAPLKLIITAHGDPKAKLAVSTTVGDGIKGCSLTIDSQPHTGDLYIQYGRKGLSSFARSLCVLAMLILFCIAYCLVFRGRQSKGSGRAGTAVCFIALYLLYVMRTPGDSFTSYLWAEDGQMLMTDAIAAGLKSITLKGNGAYWVIPKLIGVVCYWISLPFQSITHLATFQGLVTKLVGAASIGWFLSDRFSWVLKDLFQRFLVCAGIIFLMPAALDVYTCDTSIQFLLNFTVFLVGLDLLVNKKIRAMSWPVTGFLLIQTLSSAAAPVTAAVAGCGFLRWIFDGYRKKQLKLHLVLIEIAKVGIIGAAAILQILTAFSGSRVSGSLQLWDRIIACLKVYPFFPYYQSMQNWGMFVFCIVCWIAILFLAKFPVRLGIYCFSYSWLFLCMCSMTNTAEDILVNFKVVVSDKILERYILLSSMVMIFMLLIALIRIQEKRIRWMTAAVVMTVCVPIAAQAFQVRIWGEEYITGYDQNICSYDKVGSDRLWISIGPTPNWHLVIPSTITEKISEEEARGELYWIGKQAAADHVVIDTSGVAIPVNGSLTDQNGEPFEQIFLKLGDGIYLGAMLCEEEDRILEGTSEAMAGKSGEFNICVPLASFPEGEGQLEFIGKKADGTCCRKVFEFNTSLTQ